MKTDYCIFVISHGKPENQTYRTLSERCHTQIPVYIVIDDMDKKKDEYLAKYGEDKVLIFSKKEYAKKCDMMDNFDFDKVIIFARNACYDFAEKLGFKYFIEFDDDYVEFRFRFPGDPSMKLNDKFDRVIDMYFDFYKKHPEVKSLAFMQGGDVSAVFLGQVKRKVMNGIFASTERRVVYNGRLNEDVNAYTQGNKIGEIFLSFHMVMLDQLPTQTGGGMSDTYKAFGTYVKSFYSVMQNPSFIKIDVLCTSKKSWRMHHGIKFDKGCVQIISSKYKKK